MNDVTAQLLGLGILVVAGLLVAGVVRLQRRYHTVEVLVLARYPILLGLLLVLAGPFLHFGAGGRLHNLATLTWPQLVMVTALSVFAAWTVVFALRQVVRLSGLYGLPLRRGGVPAATGPVAGAWRLRSRLHRHLVERSMLWALVLAVPLVWACVWLSAPPGVAGVLSAVGAMVLGLLLAGGIGILLHWLWHDWVLEPLQAVGYLAITLAIFWMGYVVLRPDRPWAMVAWVPALGHLLIVFVLATWVLWAVAAVLDRWRVPVLPALVVASFLLYQFSRGDHYFPLAASEVLGPAMTPDVQLARWAERNPPEAAPVPVVATVGGGGVVASYWAARVLTGLQRAVPDGRFGRSLVLVSGTSGGSVGGMYFVDAYTARGGPEPGRASEILEAAAASGLSSTTWGMAYPDLLRLVTGGLLPVDPFLDRGWSLEQTWRRADGIGDRTLGEWAEGVRQGWRPAHVFNVTLAESGGPLRISPVAFPGPPSQACGSPRADFLTLYEGLDIELATAARLAVSFPWVLPLARGWAPGGSVPDCHLGDGGYTDASGVWTALEFLGSVGTEPIRNEGRRRVLLLETGVWDRPREAPEGLPRGARELSSAGWVSAAVGPVRTMVAALFGTQDTRDDFEMCLLQQGWAARGVEIRHVAFELGVRRPAFWGLPAAARDSIESAWVALEGTDAFADVRSLFLGSAEAATRGGDSAGPVGYADAVGVSGGQILAHGDTWRIRSIRCAEPGPATSLAPQSSGSVP